jgi:non-specific protein-tyrosine kinase
MGQRVILVDSDFRRASQNQIFNLPNETGLSSVLQHPGASVLPYLQDAGVENLSVLTSGPLPESPNLLESERMRGLLQEFLTLADVVLFDSPPILVVADAATLGTMMDGVILLVEAGNTRADEISYVVSEMQRIHVPFIGAVLNRVPRKKKSYYYSYYYYGHTNGRRPRRRLVDRLTGRLKRQPAPMPPPPTEPAPAAPKPDGPAKPRRKAGASKKKPAAEVQPASPASAPPLEGAGEPALELESQPAAES